MVMIISPARAKFFVKVSSTRRMTSKKVLPVGLSGFEGLMPNAMPKASISRPESSNSPWGLVFL